MKTMELFCGTKSFSKVADERGHIIFTVDNETDFKPQLYADLRIPRYKRLILDLVPLFDAIWMSPPCTTFSMASGNTHWTKERIPKTNKAVFECPILHKIIKVKKPQIKHMPLFMILVRMFLFGILLFSSNANRRDPSIDTGIASIRYIVL